MKHDNYFKTVCVFVCIFVCVLTSCRPNTECVENLDLGLICEYTRPYKDKTGQTQYARTWDSITVQGINCDEPLYDNAKRVTKLMLPMKAEQDSTMYSIHYHGKTDTLTVHHTNQMQFISIECGCIYEHDLLEISTTHNWIDSIEILTDTMRRSGASNINIWDW